MNFKLRVKKTILYGLGGIFAVGLIFVVNLVWFKPFFINHFFERAFIELAFDSPQTLTTLRLLEQIGINGHNADLDDQSLAFEAKQFQKLLDDIETLNAYADEDLDGQKLLSKRILKWFLELQAERNEFRHHNYPLNQLFGVQNNFPSFMDSFHQVGSVEDGEHYISRLSQVPRMFGQVMEGLRLREEKGILPPTFVVEKVLDEMNAFVAGPAEENILFASFKRKLEEADEVGKADRERLLAGVKLEIEDSVYPAYQAFIDYFTELLPKTTSDAGVWKLPNGEQYYNLQLKQFNTTDLTADEIHQLGLSEVDRIQAEIRTVLEAEGYDPSLGFTEMISAMAEDERFYYPDTDEGREQILTDYQVILDEINKGLNDAFRIRPEAGVEVLRVPAFKEKTAPGAYYNRPSMDGERPGAFYANLYDIKATPKYGMRTLAYHEGVPGHHFQIAIQMELKGLPTFRNILGFSAFAEGWALYAEKLAWELGFQDDPYNNIGRLQAELFRGVRLVVDTGVHAKRWTREEAIQYMRDNTGWAESDVVSEIERYIVLPGQATAYKVGMMEILRLRRQAKEALGDKFDLRDFHDVVLKNGQMPLSILREIVEEYIAENKG
jgi:uncharacterized protein (DUF885 family)